MLLSDADTDIRRSFNQSYHRVQRTCSLRRRPIAVSSTSSSPIFVRATEAVYGDSERASIKERESTGDVIDPAPRPAANYSSSAEQLGAHTC